MSEKSKIGSIGLIGFGQVGQTMAGVLNSHYQVYITDLNKDACLAHPLTQEGKIKFAESAQELAASVDLLVFCLPTPEASIAVAGAIKESAREGLILLETSTVTPEIVFELDSIMAPRGVMVIDAAVIGGIAALSQGRGVFLVGAREDENPEVSKVLGYMAAEVFYIGKQGGGMRAKLVCNGVSHTVYIVLAEAAAVAAAQEIPMETFYRLMARESGLSRPLTHRVKERLFERNFRGGMSTANARKDSKLFLETANSLNVPMFVNAAAHSLYEIAAHEGMAKDDYAIVATLWEKWLNVKLSPEATE